MDSSNIESISEIISKMNDSGFGRLATVLATLSETGLESLISGGSDDSEKEDPLKSPAWAARYFGISLRTLREKWTPAYGIQSVKAGKNRRYRLSELNRVAELLKHGESIQD